MEGEGSSYSTEVVVASNRAVAVSVEQPRNSPIVLPESDSLGTEEYVKWGSGNNFPKKILEQVAKSPSARRMLSDLSLLHFGLGPVVSKDGAPIKVFESGEAQNWLKRNQWLKKQLFIIQNYTHWGAMPIEIRLSKNRKIYDYKVHSMAHVRLSPNGDKAFFSKVWPTSKKPPSLPILSEDDPIGELNSGKGYHYVYLPKDYDMINSHYPDVPWMSVYHSGWLEISTLLPSIQKSLLNNGINLIYHIEISERYLELRFKGFRSLTDDEKRAKVGVVRDEIQTGLAGAENAGKSIFSIFGYDKAGNEEHGIKITSIKREYPDNVLTKDVNSIDAMTYTAGGVDPAIVGMGQSGGKDLSGSGSDKRMSYNLHMIKTHPSQTMTAQCLAWMLDYNFGPGHEVTYKVPQLSTTDKEASGVVVDPNDESR